MGKAIITLADELPGEVGIQMEVFDCDKPSAAYALSQEIGAFLNARLSENKIDGDDMPVPQKKPAERLIIVPGGRPVAH